MVGADQAQHNMRVDAADGRPTASPNHPNPGGRPGGTGRTRPASPRSPEPPPLTVPVREQTRIERIPLTDADTAPGGAGGDDGQGYAVVLHTVPATVAAGTGPAEQVAVSTTDTGLDDDTGIVRSVN